ncbi:pickpocket protein 19-like [Musca domestica]|uniref:Pickpocket protein 19-like n=1 Tax=Musca domestica TaxID=7370 RepID=A0ABM3UVA5_MUSDO|nr:pickpocket protein 19-like [Musca domestica]
MNESGRGMICDCIDNCESLLFLAAVNAQPVPSTSTNVTAPVIYIDIYYNRKTLTKYEARLRYTFLNMVGYIGGVFGLFWGASVLSLVEICYAIVRLFLGFLWRRMKKLRRSRRIATKLSVIKE